MKKTQILIKPSPEVNKAFREAAFKRGITLVELFEELVRKNLAEYLA